MAIAPPRIGSTPTPPTETPLSIYNLRNGAYGGKEGGGCGAPFPTPRAFTTAKIKNPKNTGNLRSFRNNPKNTVAELSPHKRRIDTDDPPQKSWPQPITT